MIEQSRIMKQEKQYNQIIVIMILEQGNYIETQNFRGLEI
jgi:hypothetical protein